MSTEPFAEGGLNSVVITTSQEALDFPNAHDVDMTTVRFEPAPFAVDEGLACGSGTLAAPLMLRNNDATFVITHAQDGLEVSCPELKVLREENAFLSGLVHDLKEDSSAYARGRADGVEWVMAHLREVYTDALNEGSFRDADSLQCLIEFLEREARK